ncbi:hypothetical protein SDC9_112820 [bioreactor metagenome]|uniref:RecA family profile 2 domain-containing protein n=1 Tax=bioreactor metagenome TaxID=1076179 RepID=A0A645BKX8_9ZZZZ
MRRVGGVGAEGVEELRRLVQRGEKSLHHRREPFRVVFLARLQPQVKAGGHAEPHYRRRREDVRRGFGVLRGYLFDLVGYR